MTNLKLWIGKCWELKERYWVIAETDDEASDLIVANLKEQGTWAAYTIEIMDYYNIEKQVITIQV